MFLEIFTASGPFGGIATLLGVAGTVVALRQVLRRQGESTASLCLAAAAWCVGLLGTGIGQRFCFDAVRQVSDPEQAELMWRAGTSVAELSTSVGAFWAAIVLVLVAIARAVRR